MTDDGTTIAVSHELRDRLKEKRIADGETMESVLERLLDHSEATQAERGDADPEAIAEEVTTALANGDVPVTLAEGQLEKLRTVGADE